MDERTTDRPGDIADATLPSAPESPAPLFAPLPPAITEPVVDPTASVTVATVPPTTPPVAADRTRSVWPKRIAIGALVLLLGAMVGWFGGMPQRSSLTDQRDEARVQVEEITADLQAVQAQLDDTQADLAGMESDLADTESRLADTTATMNSCSDAATAGRDLSDSLKNLIGDFFAWLDTPYGSAAEAQMQTHINEQTDRLDAQTDEFDRLYAACNG